MKEYALCIGGAADGEMRSITRDDPHLTVIQYDPASYPPVLDTATAQSHIRYSYYRLERISSHSDGNWVIWVDTHITLNEAFDRLLTHYRPIGRANR